VRHRFGNFHLDSNRRALGRGDQEIHLKPKAFQLLQFLLEKSPAVVSHEEIDEHLWPDTFVDVGSIHSLISQIRDALGDDDHRVVRTSYGTGFYVETGSVERSPSRFEVIVGDREIRLVEGVNLIGRDWDAQVRIDARSISRYHARIVITENRAVLEDLGSKNGTAVRGQRVAEPAVLSSGDRIVVGTVSVIFRLLPELRTTEDVRDSW